MKSKNLIIVRCKQPIKIKKPLQCLSTFSGNVGKIFFRLFCCLFSLGFYFSMPSKVIISNKVYVPGHKYISQSSF